MLVEIWSDVNCPFCYLGKARLHKALETFEHRDDVEVSHRAFELEPGLPATTSRPVVSEIAAKYGTTPVHVEANERALAAQAAELGLGYVTQGRDYGSSFDMHRLIKLAQDQGGNELAGALLDAFYTANFADAEPVFGSTERLVGIAAAVGLEPARVREVLTGDEYAEDVRDDERTAASFGVTGVPFFVFERKYAVSGAQPVSAFGQALAQAWADR